MLCEHPTVILNESELRRNLNHPLYVTRDGKCIYVHQPEAHYTIFRKNIPAPKKVEYHDAALYQVTDKATGECFPLYMVVPCGKCICCRHTKRNEYAARVTLECNENLLHTPLFLTLTYNDWHLPTVEADSHHYIPTLRRDDIQLFIKRLRKRLSDDGLDSSFKYVYCGEYGTKFKRPHYHMVIIGFPDTAAQFRTFMDIQRYIQNVWYQYKYDYIAFKKDYPGQKWRESSFGLRMKYRIPIRDEKGSIKRDINGKRMYEQDIIGYIQVKPVTQSGGCIAYVSKYMGKDSDYYEDNKAYVEKPFFRMSNFMGVNGILRAIRNMSISDLNSLNSIPVRDLRSGKFMNLPMTAYVKNVVFGKPVMTSIPTKVMEKIRLFFEELQDFRAASELYNYIHASSVNTYYDEDEDALIYDEVSDPFLYYLGDYHKDWQKVIRCCEWYSKNTPLLSYNPYGLTSYMKEAVIKYRNMLTKRRAGLYVDSIEFDRLNKFIFKHNEYLENLMNASAAYMDNLAAEILQYDKLDTLNEQYYKRKRSLQARTAVQVALYSEAPERNSTVIADKLRAAQRRSELREVF